MRLASARYGVLGVNSFILQWLFQRGLWFFALQWIRSSTPHRALRPATLWGVRTGAMAVHNGATQGRLARAIEHTCKPAFSASEAGLHDRDSPGSALCALNGSAAHCLTANPHQIELVCVAHIQPVPLYYIFSLPGQSVGTPRTYSLLSCSVGFRGSCRFMRTAMIPSSTPHPAPLPGNALGGMNGGNCGT